MTLFEKMVADMRLNSTTSEDNIQHEVMQKIALAGLARGGFFNKAAFYGETCLHLLHGLERYSEDMDFSLLSPDPNFNFESYFPAVVEEFKLAGKEVEIKLKHKGVPSAIESAFLKESSEVFDIGFTTEKRLKVKIEVDIDPPLKFATEMQILADPRMFWVRSYNLPGLYAGKLSAVLFRNWRTRVKGRDWYDLAWYIAHNVQLDLAHFIERVKQSDELIDVSTPDKVISAIDQKINAIDFENAKNDVLSYLSDKHEVEYWSKEYFHNLVHKMRFR